MKVKISQLIKRPEIIAALILSVFGVASALLMPVLEVPDENAHFQISYAIFSKDKKAPDDLVFSESILPGRDEILAKINAGEYKKLFTEKSDAQYDGVSINTGSEVFDGKTKASVFDLMHLPQAIGILIGKLIYPSVGVMVVAGRLFNLALYIVGLYLIIKHVRYGKWIFVFIASLPIMVQQAASLSYDPINLLTIFAWIAFCINLMSQKTRVSIKQIAIGVVLAALLLVSKLNNALLLLLLLAMPLWHVTDTALYKKIRMSRQWKVVKYFGVLSLLIIGCIGFYIMSIKLLGGHEFQPRRLVEVLFNTYLFGDLMLIDVTAIGMVGQFSNFYYHLPIWTIILTFAILAILLLSTRFPNVSKRFAIVSGLLFLGSILLISIGMYYGWAMRPERLGVNAMVTDGIQGRYFTPLLLLLIPVFAYLRRYIKVSIPNQVTTMTLVIVPLTLLLILYVVQTINFFWLET